MHITSNSFNKVARFRLASISSIKISNNVDLEPKFFEHFSSRANIEPKNFEPISSRATFDHLNFRAERVDLRACNGSFTSLSMAFVKCWSLQEIVTSQVSNVTLLSAWSSTGHYWWRHFKWFVCYNFNPWRIHI